MAIDSTTAKSTADWQTTGYKTIKSPATDSKTKCQKTKPDENKSPKLDKIQNSELGFLYPAKSWQ
jgi:hypothetical protein